ncbi:transcriptional regulator [Ligilactobacillus acidipiscis DSM 15836]|uniref:MarR family transcriptional regulator n=2 Tax=Ligilactobacillus acidipiscis TaxID=89059 RepID=A0A921F6P9_9LACO|nr:MarR family transcriptional regulator [Ligilactobacillus acidipiscis]KRM31507.1 transcriptional regulator [Ligilactobacillus acidipiscis DSM 15836]WEV55864.1 MarR family transcriptional regulator [Ligilactobacillus acidipiscis]GAW63155.1 MarR family transcriptional regulator [Ligilactobacillus acidipiscis]GEN20097.1 MarR family transcriptional regulator [Ligilactobacillus acidipiscis]HJE96390.1 MarR family transcriptional regulator [Ligilactobacillus acidipiscis]
MKASLDVLLDVQKNYKQLLKKMTRIHTLTIAEWQLLQNVLDGNDTQTELVKKTKLDVSTLSRQLSKLVEKNLLSIKKMGEKPMARKKYLYQITDQGRTALNEMNADFEKMSSELFSQWTNEEQNLLKILLNRLNTSFERIES